MQDLLSERLLYLTGVIPALARILASLLRPLDLPAAFTEKLISGIFEMSGGIYGIVGTGQSLPSITAAAFMLGWAGLSVHFQVLDFMCDSGLSPRPYIIGKLLHGGLSAALTYLGARALPFDVQASKTVSGQINAIYGCSGIRLFACALVCCVAAWAVLWLVLRIFARK